MELMGKEPKGARETGPKRLDFDAFIGPRPPDPDMGLRQRCRPWRMFIAARLD